MKTLLLVVFALGSGSSMNLHGAEPWREQPALHGLAFSASSTMTEYEFWMEGRKKGDRSSASSDQTINVMAETTFLAIQMALQAHPNPVLLEQCLIFLGTIVPPEFEHFWYARILEMADLDQATTKKVDEMLKLKKLPSLEQRAMGVK